MVAAVEYRPIAGFPGYRIGTDASVWSCWTGGGKSRVADERRWRRIRTRPNIYGYVTTALRRGCRDMTNQFVHRLMLLTFIGPPPAGSQACHNNGVRNDNRLENLRWGTPESNLADKRLHGTWPAADRNGRAKLSSGVLDAIRAEYARGGVFQRELADRYGVAQTTISRVLLGTTWQTVPAEVPHQISAFRKRIWRAP